MRQPRPRSLLQGLVEQYAYPASSSDGRDPIHDVILPKCERSVGDVEHRVKAREVVLDLRSRCEEANSREMSPNAVGLVNDCRSEEHTSELQSQSNLVCRLLLEKKKKCTYIE